MSLLAGVALVLLGDNGPVRRRLQTWRENVRTRKLIEAQWPRLTAGPLRLDSVPHDTSDQHTVIEFTDFQCPACRQAFDTVALFLKNHPRAHLILHNFPLEQIHHAAKGAAAAALCAAKQGEFPAMYQWLFSTGDWEDGDDWVRVAQAVHVHDLDAFAHCIHDPATERAIAADVELGKEIGVAGTPTFVSRGQRHGGGLSMSELETMAQMK